MIYEELANNEDFTYLLTLLTQVLLSDKEDVKLAELLEQDLTMFKTLSDLIRRGQEIGEFRVPQPMGDKGNSKGVIELIEGGDIPIKNIVIPKTLIVDETFQEFRSLLRKHSINLQMIEAGDYLQDGAMGITCLHPSADFRPSTVNSYSMVLSVNLGEFDLLLTGDLELNGEKAILEVLTQEYELSFYSSE